VGNVMAVLNDRKYYKDTDADDEAAYFDPVFMAATDYYPFGYEMLSAIATAINAAKPQLFGGVGPKV
jgi:hypothetical protein